MPRQSKSRVALWVRILLVVPLPLIAFAVYQAGQNPRSGLFESSSLAAGGTAAQHRAALPAHLPGADFALVDTIQLYDASNLYEKIDGHDAAFFRFGFISLTFASYSRDGAAFVDVYAYRLNRRENALGIFAAERSDSDENLPILDAAYRSGGALFFYRGPWYVQITPSEKSPEIETAIAELADSLILTFPAPAQPLPQLSWFPAGNRVTNSEGFFPDNAFGTDFIGEVFTAQYEAHGSQALAFRHQSDSAAEMFSRYATFLSEVATPAATVAVGNLDVRRFTAYGEQTWITLSNNNFIGVIGVTDSTFADAVMTSFIGAAQPGNGGD